MAPKSVLRVSDGKRLIKGHALDDFVERCLRERVRLIAVMGDECSLIEDLIDEIVVGDASDDSRDILTSSHPGESLDEVIGFASSLTGEFEGEVDVVDL
jgi:hypothetical protein